METHRISALLAAALLLLAGAAAAQVTTGKLIGRVTDGEGAPLPGATVTVTSPALLGGPRVEESDADGRYEFPNLAPGVYRVRVDLGDFVPQERTEVEVRLDRTTEIRVQMAAGEFDDELIVTAQTPVVDPQQVSTSVNFDDLYLENASIGTANRSYQSVLTQAPGVTTVTGGGSNPNVFGSTYEENAFFVDGSNTTDVVTMTFGTNFNFDAIAEISFQTGGYEAEYGQATGGVVNVITKSGGNDFHGTADVRYDDESFRESGDFFDPDQSKVENLDSAFTLGGPVLRDQLWFFSSYERPESDFQATGSPTVRAFSADYYLAKLSYQLTPAWLFVAQTSGDPAEIENAAANPEARLPESQAFQEQGGNITQASASGVLSDSLLVDVKLSRNRQELDRVPSSGDLETPSFLNVSTGRRTGNYENAQFSDRDRDEAKGSLTWFTSAAGDHEVKVGAEYSALDFASSNFTTGDYAYTTRIVNGAEIPRSFSLNANRDVQEATGEVTGLYAQDAWRPLPSLTVKLGLRYDRAQFENNVGEQAGDLDELQPRLGVAWDATGDGRTYLRASWGRFMHPASTRIPSINAFDNSSQPRVSAFACDYLRQFTFGVGPEFSCAELADAAHDLLGFEGSIVADPLNLDPEGWVVQQIIGATGEGILIDPDLEATHADTLILSAEREIYRRTSLELTWVDKETSDIFEDTCNGNLGGNRMVGAPCTNFALTNLSELRREYQGAILQAESRAVDWLHVNSSLTWSESKGSIEATQFAGGDYDVFPDDFVNRFGYLSDHRRWRFKLNGYVELPKRFTLGVDGFWSSPYVYNVTDAANTTGNDTLFVERRGSRQGNETYQLDLQLAKALRIGAIDLSLIGSVFNVLDSEQPTRRCEDVSGCAVGNDVVDLGDPIVWQRPRSYQAGVRIVF